MTNTFGSFAIWQAKIQKNKIEGLFDEVRNPTPEARGYGERIVRFPAEKYAQEMRIVRGVFNYEDLNRIVE